MDKKICGNHSVYYQVIRYAHAHGEIKRLAEYHYREKVREALLEKYPKKFCDYKSNFHVCEDDQTPLEESIVSLFSVGAGK